MIIKTNIPKRFIVNTTITSQWVHPPCGDISFFQQMEGYLAARNRLIYDARNNYRMKLIPDLIRENSCFIAAGAGHLRGETGLINQLQQLGYTVVPN